MARDMDELEAALRLRISEYEALEERYGPNEVKSQKQSVRGAILYLRDQMLSKVSEGSDLPEVPERMLRHD